MYRWVEHTGELELEIAASSEEGVFGETLHALAELLGDADSEAALVTHELEVEAPDRPLLLVEWLESLVFLAETRCFMPRAADALELDGTRLRATVSGTDVEPPHLVKAVTLHDLAFEPSDRGWHARVVLDV